MSHTARTVVAVLVGLTAGFAIAIAQESASSKESPGVVSAADAKFMKEAADGGMTEVELGQLASQKASSDSVKQFGERMVQDHGKANEELKQLANQKHVDLPQRPSAKHNATKQRLSQLSGDEFDRAYVAEMVKDHKEDVAAFQHATQTAKDPDVKSFASQTLPTLQDHLKQIESIKTSQNMGAASR